jgi:hypothetical protein
LVNAKSREPNLRGLLRKNLSGIEAAYATSRFVEVTRDALAAHE